MIDLHVPNSKSANLSANTMFWVRGIITKIVPYYMKSITGMCRRLFQMPFNFSVGIWMKVFKNIRPLYFPPYYFQEGVWPKGNYSSDSTRFYGHADVVNSPVVTQMMLAVAFQLLLLQSC